MAMAMEEKNKPKFDLYKTGQKVKLSANQHLNKQLQAMFKAEELKNKPYTKITSEEEKLARKNQLPVVKRWLHSAARHVNITKYQRVLPTAKELAKLSGTGPEILPEEMHPSETCFICNEALPIADWKGCRLVCCGVRIHCKCSHDYTHPKAQNPVMNVCGIGITTMCPLCGQLEGEDFTFMDKINEWSNKPNFVKSYLEGDKKPKRARFAITYLADVYRMGLNDVPRNMNESFLHYNDSVVATNCPVASFRLAELADKIGVGNEKKGFESCKHSAELNLPEAMHRLANYYEAGYGCDQDFQLMGVWMLLAAQYGHVPSQTQMGCIHRNGQLGVQDIAQSIYWFEMAAFIGTFKIEKLRSQCFDTTFTIIVVIIVRIIFTCSFFF